MVKPGRTRRWALGAVPAILAAGAGPVHALAPREAARVERALAWLNGLRAAEGRFAQTDPRGVRTEGRFWIERPGRARFEYGGGRDLLVVSDGDVVSVLDRRLKTQDQYPLEQTPLHLLLADPIRLGRGVEVAAVEDRPGGYRIVLKAARADAPGRLALDFDDAPLALRGWTVQDAQNGRTDVRISALARRAALPATLFAAPGAADRP